MGGGGDDKNHLHFNFHHHHDHHHHHHQVPKGCVAVMVGTGEKQQRFVVPVKYVNHPLFTQLLKEAEEENGFHHQGPINIPCQVEEFRQVQGIIIHQEKSHYHQVHHSWPCFKA